MTRRSIDTLILDLDNTIFDWFAVWYASFKPVYDEMIAISGKSSDEVDASIRRVHQVRRTSEYSFLIEEADVLEHVRANGDVRERFQNAINESRRGRDQNLRLYPSVFPCLWELKKKGTKIIAYTESMGFYSAYRLKRFGLDGVIDVLFSPEDHELPAGASVEKLRRLPDEFYQLQVTKVLHTPPGELKPNPRVLLDIIRSVGASTERCAYVGDSLFKDVAMARDAGVLDLHAQYGESQRKPEYSLLQRVSHWTEADVQREKGITAKGLDFEPTITLKDSFAEIFMHCDFIRFEEPVEDIGPEEERKNAVEIWKKCVDVHQHFNDLEMRIRNYAITVVGALIAAVSFTYKEGLHTQIFGYDIPSGLGLVAAAIFAWGGFFLMDRYWYHILLRGAVAHSAKIETRYAKTIPEIDLGKTISEVSGNVRILGMKMNSSRRLEMFYAVGAIMLTIILAFLFFATPAKLGADTTNAGNQTQTSKSKPATAKDQPN